MPGRVNWLVMAKTSGCTSNTEENAGQNSLSTIEPLHTVTTTAPTKNNDIHQLDSLTGGAFSAPTSGERAARVRDWLASGPSTEQLQDVFKELSARDKGASRPLREKLDEIKRTRGQEALALEWVGKAEGLLSVAKLNIADALAWQRDAAKAGAPLSKEPLITLKTHLLERVRVIEDLQHRVQVQREAAVLLAQRIEVLSTKSWLDAQAVWESLRGDVAHWEQQAASLQADSNWASVDLRFPPLLESSKGQLLVVWEAFNTALAQAVTASQDAAAALPAVPVWASELRLARGVAVESSPKSVRPRVDPEVRAHAVAVVREVLAKLEGEIADGHGKASAGAAAALRNALKEFGKLVGDKLENQAHAALAAAGELESWQRWRADQLRVELVAKAEGLMKRAATVPAVAPEGATEGEAQVAAAPAQPRLGGRKMQETLRTLREQWKQTDQGGVPNHALWKRFDEACNEAYEVVAAWLDKVKLEAAEHRAQRLALIEELKAWSAANTTALDDDWKGFNRVLHQFGDRWRDAGHLGEKAFVEMQAQWKAAMAAAAAPLEAMQKQSLERRHGMIAEAQVLGDAPVLRIDAVKALQQRWQAEAHAVPLDRRHEQKLWDAFRKPVDDAFNRKTAEREKSEAALGARDRAVLDAAKALDAANASGDAQAIRAAMGALEAATREQQREQSALSVAPAPAPQIAADQAADGVPKAQTAIDNTADGAPAEAADDSAAATEAVPAVAPPVVRKPVVAVRGDDRPGMRKAEPAAPARAGKFGERRDGGRGAPSPRSSERGSRPDSRDGAGPAVRYGERGPDRGAGFGRSDAPRLGDAAFRAQREALERADLALKKLAAQAHGEVLTQLLTAWERRDPTVLPGAQELGARANATVRAAWAKALAAEPQADASVSLLRLEMAAEVPTPADQLNARRALQLQLLTRRNDPPPAQTWSQDLATVLASGFQADAGRRVQNALKVLFRR